MKKWISLVLVAVVIIALPLSCAFAASTMYVKTSSGSSVHMRADTSTSSDVICKIGYARKVTVWRFVAGGQWAECSYNGHDGYVSARYLSYHKPAPIVPKATPAPIVVVAPAANLYEGFRQTRYEAIVVPSTPGGFVHMRWAPSTNNKIIKDYFAGDPLVVVAEDNVWCQVQDPETSAVGFMMKRFVSQTIPVAGTIVENAAAPAAAPTAEPAVEPAS